MKLVFNPSIDKSKWDALVLSSPDSTVFTLSTYLDAVAEHWCILIDDKYTCGMAVPYIQRLGKRIAYTPVFFRYTEWFGDQKDEANGIEVIKKYFDAGQLNFRSREPFLTSPSVHSFQKITQENWVINDQVRRMLKRFERSDLKIDKNGRIEDVLKHIDTELKHRIPGITQRSIQRLEDLVTQFNRQGCLQTITVHSGKECVGGVFTLRKDGRTLYLKGTFTQPAKNNGAMYAVMHEAISDALNKNQTFDFGGSNATGVRRFNLNLGGIDEYYSTLIWDRLPKWYTIIQRILKWIRK